MASGSRKIRLAGLVIERRGFDCECNVRELEQLAKSAASEGAQLLVTPEGFLEGYIVQEEGLTPERYAEVAQRIPGGEMYERIAAVARDNGVLLAAGMAELDGEAFYNTCALIGPDGSLIGKYRKTHTLKDEILNKLGSLLPVFDTKLGRIGIMICYDRQPPEVARILTLKGADVIVNPSAGSWGDTNERMMRTRAYENGVPIVFAHFADCLIIDGAGRLISRYETSGSRLVVADVEVGRRESTIDYRQPELYTTLSGEAESFHQT